MSVLLTKSQFLRRASARLMPYHSCSTRLSGKSLLTGLFSLVTASIALAPAFSQAAPSAMAHLAAGAVAKLSPNVRKGLQSASADSNDCLPVIVQTDGTTPGVVKPLLGKLSLAAFASARRTGNQPALITLSNGRVLAARLHPRDIAALAADPHTLHISPDLPLQASDTGTGYQDYAREATGVDFLQANSNVSGAGVTVAVVDTGIYPHADLTASASRIVGWVDLVQNIGHPYDDNGHGTHVAGLVGGNGATAAANGYNTGFARMAPNTQIVGVKALDQNGGGSVSLVIAGIDWVVAHRAEFNIRVLNLSVGHTIGESYQTDPLCQACERAYHAGITVVVAAGNNGRSVPSDPSSPTQYGSITSPGNDPYVITVGAMNTKGTLSRTDDIVCTYSSRGPSVGDLVLKPDIVAPGNAIVSLASPGSTLVLQAGSNLLDPGSYGGTGSKSYLALSGTSMATPIVAGAAALLLQADPTLTPDTVKARLMLSATKTETMDYMSYGAGYLNVVGALALTQVMADHAISPSLTRNTDGTVNVVNFAWGGNIAGLNFGWGDNGEKITSSNFGWGDNGEKTKGITHDDFMTAQNFGWGDNGFTGMGVFGPQQLPANVGPTNPALWNGSITNTTTPTQTDSLHLMRQGD